MREDLEERYRQFLPGISIDCVIFGFHQNQLKVLLLRMKNTQLWALPGGFVRKKESLEVAATRVLEERTGLKNIFLQQFHVFSDPLRSYSAKNIADLKKIGISVKHSKWFSQRFITVGFYALVDFSKVNPLPDELSENCEWFDPRIEKELMIDHSSILKNALNTLRNQLSNQPIGYNLLPEKFTMTELRKLYETILGKSLDRRNFQRKFLSYGILRKLKEQRTGSAHKSPYLFKFDLPRYHKALKEGLKGTW
jgi:8-oxo-dGTP diphosphatase